MAKITPAFATKSHRQRAIGPGLISGRPSEVNVKSDSGDEANSNSSKTNVDRSEAV
jgi:hypothetical protein